MSDRRKPGKNTLASKVLDSVKKNFYFYNNRKIAVAVTSSELNIPMGYANNIFKKHIKPELDANG